MRIAVDLHEHLIEVPPPAAEAAHVAHAALAHLDCEHRTEAVPPDANRLVAKIEAALEQQMLDISQVQREANVIITTRRISSGDELKYRNGLGGSRGRGITAPYLPVPGDQRIWSDRVFQMVKLSVKRLYSFSTRKKDGTKIDTRRGAA